MNETLEQKIQEIKKLPINTVDEAGVVAVKLFEIACEKHTANEEAFFIAGFTECYKFLNIKKYIAVIDKDFGIIFPDFLGCVSVGDNIDDAKIKAQEVLQFHIQGMREDGEELPEPKTIEWVKEKYPNQFYFMVEIC